MFQKEGKKNIDEFLFKAYEGEKKSLKVERSLMVEITRKANR